MKTFLVFIALAFVILFVLPEGVITWLQNTLAAIFGPIVGVCIVIALVWCVGKILHIWGAFAGAAVSYAFEKPEQVQAQPPTPTRTREPHTTRVVVHNAPAYPPARNPTAVQPQRANMGATRALSIPKSETQRIINDVISHHSGGDWKKDLDL